MRTLKFHGWKPVCYRRIIWQIIDSAEAGDETWIADYIQQAVSRFIDRWKREPEAVKLGMVEVEKAIARNISENVNKSIDYRKMEAVAEAIRSSLKENDVTPVVLTNKSRLTITIEVATVDMMILWRSVIPLEKFTDWDDALTISDIKTVDHLIKILNDYNKRYELPSLRSRYESHMLGFKPYTGDWFKLCKLAARVTQFCLQQDKSTPSP
jgi:hypothetical protein